MGKRMSIKSRLVILSILIVAANAILGFYVIYTGVENIILGQHMETLNGVARIVANSIKDEYTKGWISLYPPSMLSQHAPDITQQFIEEFRPVAQKIADRTSTAFPGIGIGIYLGDIPIYTTGQSSEPSLSFTQVAFVEVSGQQLMKVVTWESKEGIAQAASRVAKSLLKAIAALIILSLMITGLLIQNLTKDIDFLVSKLKDFARKDRPPEPIPTDLPSELAAVAETLNNISYQLAKTIDTMKKIIESSPTALILLDKEGKETYISQSAQQLLGGKSPVHWLNSLGIDPSKPGLFHRLRLGPKILNIHIIPIADGTLIALEDITQISKLEEDLRIKERLAAMGTLSAGIAHEIRNPLTSIKGFAQMINLKSSDEQAKRYAKQVIAEVERLEKLVKDILAYAKRQQVHKIPVRLSELVEEAKKNLSIPVEVEGDAMLCADKTLMATVLSNIFKNAQEAGATLIEVKATEQPNRIDIFIEDNGPGIPEDILPHIFEPFRTSKAKGTGLGLAISHNIIESHGGEITVWNKPEGGSVFRITLRKETCGDAE